jgi:hypothetical protein
MQFTGPQTLKSPPLENLQVERNPDSKVPVPGPGAYSIPDSFGKARQSLPDSLQCFNRLVFLSLTLRLQIPVPKLARSSRMVGFLDLTPGNLGKFAKSETEIVSVYAPYLEVSWRPEHQCRELN